MFLHVMPMYTDTTDIVDMMTISSSSRVSTTAVTTAAVNLPYTSTQVKACVDQEQSKTLWVPSGSL